MLNKRPSAAAKAGRELLRRLNRAADLPPKGIADSAGLTVNRQHELPRVESRHEYYANRGAAAAPELAAESG